VAAGCCRWGSLSARGGRGASGPAALLVRVVVPLLISYALLAILAVALPRASRTLVADLSQVERLPAPLAFAVAAVLTAVAAALLVSLWTQTAAVLVRPVFTWTGDEPTVQAVAR